ncbi:MAG TPA: orotidine-5'-phosphate decarboxylase [Anaerolineae bacterium]|nr:orotidine-5'-phosphate decarboxylase [Anaerolineae bacterium]
MSFFTRLTDRCLSVDSLLCIGLDPHVELLRQATAEEARDFCCRLIEATADQACAFKPNSAFFEVFGAEGWTALREVIAAVPEGIPVILDAKRGDIASTAQAYSRAVFETLGADAVTLSPYLGSDSLEPFLADPERGVFLLCKTSNPSADDLQALNIEGIEPLYLRLARLASGWNTADNLGLVVGATDPITLAQVRRVVPDMWLLAPGVGAQGGNLEGVCRAGLRQDGLGMVIPVSRGIAQAEAPRAEAIRLKERINSICESMDREAAPVLSSSMAALADALLEAGCVRFGEFKLKSGAKSPIYIDLRLLASKPNLLTHAASAYLPILQGLHYDRLAALPYAALPIATAISLQTGRPMVYPRKEIKDYGTGYAVEGGYERGEKVVLIDDLVTTGGSKFEGIERLEAAGLEVHDVVVLIDREGGAAQELAEAGYRLHAVYTLSQLIEHWVGVGKVSPQQADEVKRFMGIRD